MAAGADPNIECSSGYKGLDGIPLHVFIYMNSRTMNNKKYSYYSISAFNKLLSAGALIAKKDSIGRTPLHTAAISNNVAAAKILIKADVLVDIEDDRGKTPIHYAESAEMIKLLKAK